MAQYNNPYGQQYAQYPGVATTPFQTVSVPTSTVSQVGSSQYNTPYLGTTGQYIVQTNPNLSQLQSVFQQTQTSSYQQPTTQSYQIPTATTYQQSAYHTTTGAYQQPSAYQHHYAQHPQQIAQPLPLNANFTNNAVWMGDIDSWMDENFIYSLFAHTGELVNVKLIRDKQTGTTANYCFVYFTTPLAAQKVIENFNGQPIPGTSKVFKLNWAQFGAGKTSQQQQKVEKPVVPVPMKKPPSGSEEVISLFVGDLAPDVTDYMILSTFQYYYPSCYSAKVVTDPNTGMSKGYGFVYFHDENDKARALTEMQGYYLSYRPIRLNIATKKGETKPSTQGTQPPIEQQQLKSPQHAGPQPKPQHSTQKQEVDPSNTTVFVGAIDHTINHHVLTAFFQPFGEIVQIKTPLGKGCAFIEYTTHEAAKKVLETFNGNALIGTCQVRLSWGRPSKSSSQTQPQSTEKTEQSTDKTETSDKPEISDKTEATVAPTTEEYVPEPVAVLTTNEEYVPGQETVITTTSNPEEIQIQFNEPVEQPTTEQSEQSVQFQQAEITGDQETTEQPQETEVQSVGEEITSTKTDNVDSTTVESAEQKETVDTEQSQLEKRPAEEEEEHPAKKRKTEEESSS